MSEIRFQVQGSSPEPYEVRFVMRDRNNLSAYCTCAAGQNGQYCKHRFRILSGETEGIVSDNPNQVLVVASWLPGTDIEARIKECITAEQELEQAKQKASEAKRALTRSMRD